jgi:hypothetical protein
LEEGLLSGISDNKVGVRSSSVWLVWRAAGQSSHGLFFKSPWWKMKERFCEVGFFNKRTPSVLHEAVRSSLLSHRGGGGRLGIRSVFVFFTSGGYGDTVIAYAFGSESSTASRRSATPDLHAVVRDMLQDYLQPPGFANSEAFHLWRVWLPLQLPKW